MTDNSWYERGELPPVGLKCEVIEPESSKVVIVAHDQRESAMVAVFKRVGFGYGNPYDCYIAGYFRPLKSDRDKAIEAALKVYHRSMDINEVFSDMYEAGLLRLPD